MKDFPMTIHRLSEPICFDSAPYLTICEVNEDNSAWVQINPSESTLPNWIRFDTLEQADKFRQELKNRHIIDISES